MPGRVAGSRADAGCTRCWNRSGGWTWPPACVAEGNRCLALTGRGLGMVARRDRAAVGAARQRWSAVPVDPKAPLTWRNVTGSRSRQLLRHFEHTQAVHRFLAALAVQSRARGWPDGRFDPPRRASRFFHHDGSLHSVRPDAFGVVGPSGDRRLFFLEWERRAVRPVTMAARIAPYLRYYSTRRPLDDHGVVPLVLVVFDDEIATGHFLRLAANGDAPGRGHGCPCWVSHRDAIQRIRTAGEGVAITGQVGNCLSLRMTPLCSGRKQGGCHEDSQVRRERDY